MGIGKQEGDSPIPSDLRVSPRQARARETVQRILDTAAVLLDEVGVDGFNTNLLAERAEVRVRTVYRYFPNKSAVIVALAERVVSEWDAWALDELAKLDGDGDWRTAVELATRGLLQRVRELPGHAAIRRAMRAVPELYVLDQRDNVRLAEAYAHGLRRVARELATRGLLQRVRELPGHAAIRRAMRAVPELYLLDQRDNVRLAEAYAHGLRRVAPELAPARARRIARCLIESTVAVVDVALEQSPASARGLIDELVEMQLAYLESILV